ncbi:enolase C-terminal domain-like protein [Planotetraspora kaengkrachanensis]|uniref:Mandelate racemase n=1 Tax=Planotetraspora kaengkrachanensis TaxID=575193 RepID=A0A8J3LVR5_9ACTN|nr:enolase C-terminal domain-like protein [Planotetraspora kaengkrachanensis]GIG79267.1 mandelate racemase [Planotetraspora kaengkrachanensis]
MAVVESVEVTVFTTVAGSVVDGHGHRHPGPPREVQEALFTVTDGDGVTGHCLTQPDTVRETVIRNHIGPAILGQDSLERERLWHRIARRQRGAQGNLSDRALSTADQALWDLAGRTVGLPVWKLLGGARSEVPAYASTMCGDDIPGGLATPDDYAAFAKDLVARGYRAIKLHTWMPPMPYGVARDIAACTAVREAVGPDVALMLDSNHWYSRSEALTLGRALDELGFAWYEEPMEEASVQSYRWLADQLATPILGPETSWGKHMARAEWVAAGACDILRVGVVGSGGVIPALKAVHLAESFGMECEIHGNGSGALAVIGATTCGHWYERGLLHPHTDYDTAPPHLRSIVDPLTGGNVRMPAAPGLGDDLDHDYIAAHAVASWGTRSQ